MDDVLVLVEVTLLPLDQVVWAKVGVGIEVVFLAGVLLDQTHADAESQLAELVLELLAVSRGVNAGVEVNLCKIIGRENARH